MVDDFHSNQSTLLFASRFDTEEAIYVRERYSDYAICFNDSGEVLLVLDRSSALWGFPGGEREHESVVETIRRELLEEAGIEVIKVGPLIARQVQLSLSASGEVSQQTRDFFLTRVAHYNLPQVDGREIEQASYMPINHIASIPSCPDVAAIADYAQRVWRADFNI